FSRAMSIDGNGDSRVEGPDKPLRSYEPVWGTAHGVSSHAYAAMERFAFQGRHVLRYTAKGTGGRSVGTRGPLVIDNWKYNAFLPYANQVQYFRFYTYVPEWNLQPNIGSWITLGAQIKTTELYWSAGVQQNLEWDGSNWRWWFTHIDPSGGPPYTTIK